MKARPYRLVSDTRLQASRLRAEERLRQWCLDWGVDPMHFRIQVSRYTVLGESVASRAGQWSAAGERRWLWSAPRPVLDEAIATALFAVKDTGSETLAHQCADAALGALVQELAVADTSTAMLPAPRACGDDLVLVGLRHHEALLAIIEPAVEADTPFRNALPPLLAFDLDTALRCVGARAQIELGYTELALAELLQLETGHVVVLDHSIREPVRVAVVDSAAEVFAHLGRAGDCFAVQAVRNAKNKNMKINKDVSVMTQPPNPAQGPEVQMVDLEELPSVPVGELPLIENRIGLFSGIKTKVTAVVGYAETSIGELLAMKEGASFKLDRHVDAPIDLIVEGRVVARGQLSVLDDHFAVRVTEVIQAGAK